MTKFIAIVFFENNVRPPLKFEKWINDTSINKGQFQRFITKHYPLASYANLYDKSNNKYHSRLKF